MSTIFPEHYVAPSNAEFARLKRAAADERAAAVKAIGHAIADWLRAGLQSHVHGRPDTALRLNSNGCGC